MTLLLNMDHGPSRNKYIRAAFMELNESAKPKDDSKTAPDLADFLLDQCNRDIMSGKVIATLSSRYSQ